MRKLLSVAIGVSILLGGGAISAFAQDTGNGTTLAPQKQQTQGVPAGTTPTEYGAKKQQTQGVPAGTMPTQYGAMKQHTQGVPAGSRPPQYGAMNR
jgi:hypothetical protein